MNQTPRSVRISEHALAKIALLKRHGFQIDIGLIEEVVTQPERVTGGYAGRKVAEKGVGPRHVLRVVFEESDDTIVVVTLYPARRRRYERH